MDKRCREEVRKSLEHVTVRAVSDSDLDVFLDEMRARGIGFSYHDGEPVDELDIIRSIIGTLRLELTDPVARIRVAEYVSSVISGELYEDG